MTHLENLTFLINYLRSENPEYERIHIPSSLQDQKALLRSLMNVRPPRQASPKFLEIQNEYLAEETRRKGVVSLSDLTPIQKGIYLWQGDITTLQTDAIVNAANSALLGCFIPCHGCIDNAIHSAAGIQLRLACSRIMEQQEYAEATGTAKITEAYNLPCRYVLHTIGPIIDGTPTDEDCRLLASCYESCLELAAAYELTSIAFCCISTGEFHFPNELAAAVAIRTVTDYQKKHASHMEVVFNVFKDTDYEIYRRLLRTASTIG